MPSIVWAADNDVMTLIDKKTGDAEIANFVVDSAPGSVSAMSLLGITGDQTFVVESPRNLTLAGKFLDKNQIFGLSITPARTSLLPMSVSTYYNDRLGLARLWAATSFGFAQGKADVKGKSYTRRAVSVETSYFFFPKKDDPLVVYWEALTSAGQEAAKNFKEDSENPCVIITRQQPAGAPGSTANEEATNSGKNLADDKLTQDLSERAKTCHNIVEKSMRWNASKAWASLATGEYQAPDGGNSHSLGRTVILGLTWGIGDGKRKVANEGAKDNSKVDSLDQPAGAITLGYKRTAGAPVLDSYDAINPNRKDSHLVTLRAAYGKQNMRVLFEGSNISSGTPTETERAYKRALGFDVRLADDFWLSLRVGKQRRIDNNGTETGSSINLSYSPKALLSL